MKNNIFIIGSRGYHAKYGGWETFTSSLVDYYDDSNTLFYVTEPTSDKSKDKHIVDKAQNVKVIYLYTKALGGATMFLHTIAAFKFVIKYVNEHKLSGKINLYILGLKLFSKLARSKNKLKKLGIKTYLNPDGLEWMRSKWSAPVKKFFLTSEKLMLNNVDCIICDAKGIKNYVVDKYPSLKNKCKYIAYGCEKFDFTKINEEAILNEYKLKNNDYCLMVGRCVPEDNYELVIKDFMSSNIDKKLIVITNYSDSKYYEELKEKTNFDNDRRIRFIDGVYDRDKLAVIRKNAFLYIHGHSVGGTNPSLIEAMSLTNLNILYDVCFNRDVGQDACLYFKEAGDLQNLLNDKDLDKNVEKLGKKSKEIVANNFTWDIIVNKYKEVFS